MSLREVFRLAMPLQCCRSSGSRERFRLSGAAVLPDVIDVIDVSAKLKVQLNLFLDPLLPGLCCQSRRERLSSILIDVFFANVTSDWRVAGLSAAKCLGPWQIALGLGSCSFCENFAVAESTQTRRPTDTWRFGIGRLTRLTTSYKHPASGHVLNSFALQCRHSDRLAPEPWRGCSLYSM